MKQDFSAVNKDLKKLINVSNLSLIQYRNLINEEFSVSEYWEDMYKNIIESTFENVKND
jgi:hypothetical protein